MLERVSLHKAAAVIHTAELAKKSAITDYGIDPAKISVLPSPPNCDHVPSRKIVMQRKQIHICNLLFVGVDWQRKGGDIAVAVVEELNRQGVPSRLQICGCRPPETYSGNPYLQTIGFLDKNLSTDMLRWEKLFLNAHFFILPTRAECMGISFSEAAGFGLPIIATDTGGVSTLVKHGRNGLLFDFDRPAADIAADIRDLWKDKDRYRAMRNESRRFFEEEISSDKWIASVIKIIKVLVPAYEAQFTSPGIPSVIGGSDSREQLRVAPINRNLSPEIPAAR
jgi:glycosyltransferase involved in cell wall biosynthesis